MKSENAIIQQSAACEGVISIAHFLLFWDIWQSDGFPVTLPNLIFIHSLEACYLKDQLLSTKPLLDPRYPNICPFQLKCPLLPPSVYAPRVKMTSVWSNPLLTRLSSWPMCLSQARQNSAEPWPPPFHSHAHTHTSHPKGSTSSATSPLPKITGIKSLQLLKNCLLCFNISTSPAASCVFCAVSGCGWHLISCASSATHLQLCIWAPVCQGTDNQWTHWPTWFVKALTQTHMHPSRRTHRGKWDFYGYKHLYYELYSIWNRSMI